MYNPQIGSSQHASSMDNPSTPENSLFFCIGPPKTAKGIHRDNRKNGAILFRGAYIYGDSIEQKTCIWSGDTYSWQDKSSGIMWVGVHGMESVCVVTMTGDVDMTRVRGGLAMYSKQALLCEFRKTIISEIEDLRSTLRQRFDKSIKKPFGVVSVIPRTNEVHKENGYEASIYDYVENQAMHFLLEKFISIQPPNGCHDGKFEKIKMDLANSTLKASSRFALYDEKKAIEFLEEKMKSNMDFTVDETIQIAISAFQHLLQKKFKAYEIEVSVMDPYYKAHGRDDECYERAGIKVLEIIDIEEHLAIINEPSTLWEGKLTPVAESPKAKALVAEAWKQKLPLRRGLAIILEDYPQKPPRSRRLVNHL